MLKVMILNETENESMIGGMAGVKTFSDRINCIVEKLTMHDDIEAITIDVIPMVPITISGGRQVNQVMIKYCTAGVLLND